MKALKLLNLTLFSLFLWSCTNGDYNDVGSSSSSSSEATSGQGGSLATFAIKGDYLYTVDYEELKVFSLVNPNEPVLVNKIWVGFEIETLFSYNQYLYIGSRSGMYIFSVEDPETPKNRSSVEHFTACDPVVANDSLAFVTLHSNRICGNDINQLEVYNIKDPDNPILLTTRGLIEPKGLGLYGHYLIICDDEIKVFDIRNPSGGTTFITSINQYAFDVIIRGDHMIAVGEEGIYQYELSSTEDSFKAKYLSTIPLLN